jgi:ribonuclease D
LPARGLAILRELTNWRDSLAQSHNVPPRTLAKDEVLIALARSPVKTVEKLSSVKGLPRPVEVAHGTDIIAAIARGLSTDLAGIELAREPELSPSQKFVGDALWSTLQAYSAGQGIDPALVGSRHEITDLVRYLTNTEKSDTPPPILQGWRHEAVGKHLAELCQGKTKFELSWTDSSLRSRSI